ncbi:MAG: alanine--glyoxylate aminotransferase family protein [Elusimicrobiota bacterium]
MTRRDYILLTPGPTPLPPSVYQKLSQPIMHHRTREFSAVFTRMIEGLKYVYRTKNDVLAAASSGTGVMEAAVANILSPGDKVLVHSTGVFGDRFAAIARAYGLETVLLAEEWGRAADPDRLRGALRENTDVRAVFHQHTDTSTGVVNDLKTLAAIVREHSDALTVVDAISGLGGEELETDAWELDVVVSASQKALMCPPGLAFVAVSQKAWRAADAAELPRFYFDWRMARQAAVQNQTPFTPAVTLIPAQEDALRLIREEGIENVWKRTAELAAWTRSEIRGLGLELFAKNPAAILTPIILPADVDGRKLVKDILAEDRISIAGGQLQLAGRIVRIAHMGYIKRSDIEAGIEALAKRLCLTKT